MKQKIRVILEMAEDVPQETVERDAEKPKAARKAQGRGKGTGQE